MLAASLRTRLADREPACQLCPPSPSSLRALPTTGHPYRGLPLWLIGSLCSVRPARQDSDSR
jgi:hypothetical protein